MPDETMPSGGGVMRRLGAAGAGFAGVFAAVEIALAPNAARARQQLEEQRRIRRSPSPADPPNLDPEGRAAEGIRVLGYRWTEPPAPPAAVPATAIEDRHAAGGPRSRPPVSP
jgi:hypothetical protein